MNNDSNNSIKAKDWKNKLISSSLPLEFEAARVLVSQNFSVTADYTYARDDSGIAKDFSVDLLARAFTPFTNPNKITASLELLVECKQRNPNTKWLFLPDINRGDLSPITIGITLRAVDEFHKGFFPSSSTIAFDRDGPFCYKGTEIDENTGRVDDSELKHGISQLQYALPRLLTDNILFQLRCHEDDNVPFLFCPILLTTSKLFILNRKVNINDIRTAKSLNDIAKCVPYLFLYSDCGPDFEKHCIKECSSLRNPYSESISDINEYRLKHGEYEFKLPQNLGLSIANGREHDYFTQFVVCSFENFPSLLRRIKQITSDMVRRISSDSDMP